MTIKVNIIQDIVIHPDNYAPLAFDKCLFFFVKMQLLNIGSYGSSSKLLR